MRTVGKRKEPDIAFSASADMLAVGARFNEEFQKLPFGERTPFPKGVRRFRTHADANRYEDEILAAHMARLAKGRNG